MKHVNLLIKPASSRCNMRCRYCFYEDLAETREQGDLGMMSPETAEELIRSAFAAASPGGEVSFAFQGGEPILAGLPFYQKFMELERSQARPGIRVSHSIQTNGLALDAVWAAFFRDHGFLVGLSVDGGRDLHDLHRVDAYGKGTWGRVTDALELLHSYGVETNVLCVVTKQCARGPERAYHALKRLGVGYLQFIPCLDPLNEPRGSQDFSLTPDLYGKFLCRLFDAWYLDWKNGRYVSIRLFDDYVHLMMGLPAGTCSTTGACGSYIVCEGDGGLYPCDFYALDRWRLGKLGEISCQEALTCEKAQAFRDKRLHKPDACGGCQWLRLCGGGCKRDWQEADGGLQNYYCASFKRFFAYAAQRLEEIAGAELALRRRLGT